MMDGPHDDDTPIGSVSPFLNSTKSKCHVAFPSNPWKNLSSS
jgi:hypothetical protein